MHRNMGKVMWLLAISISLLLTFAACQAPTPSADLTHSSNLDGNDIYWLYWKYDTETITFEVHVRTTGYIGLGFGQNGRMEGADIVIGWVKDGQTYFKDRHAVGEVMPIEDFQQNYVLVSGEERDGFTILRFYRQLDTCDDDDFIMPEGTVRVIFSWNDEDPVDENNIHYHGVDNRGTKSVLFLGAAPEDFNPDGYFIFDFVHDNVEIKAQDTYYHCKKFKQPELNGTHHIIHVSPLIEEANKAHVHHIIIYKCIGEMVVDEGNGYDCWDNTYVRCESIWLAWGIGQEDFSMPETAGLPIGDSDEPIYYEMETHYDNPLEISTMIDSSGIRLYYTEDLREHDVGILTLGQAIYYPQIALPPGMEDFVMHSYCDSACTDMIPEGGVQAFGTILHTHLAGVQVYTEIVRDGVHIGDLGQDVNYDFNYQAIRLFPTEKTILPGDQLQTTCVYDTTNRQNVTWGGLGTANEMCINFLYYYPAMEVLGCMSLVQSLDLWYDLINTTATEEGWSRGPTYDEILFWVHFYPWNPEDLDKVREFENTEKYLQYCVKAGEPAFGSPMSEQPNRMRPVIRDPYVKTNPQCEPTDSDPNGAEDLRRVSVCALLTCLMAILYTNM